MSYSALFYCVFEEINEVLENWWYIIEGEGASMIDLCDVQCIFTKGNDFRQNAISFKANLRR